MTLHLLHTMIYHLSNRRVKHFILTPSPRSSLSIVNNMKLWWNKLLMIIIIIWWMRSSHVIHSRMLYNKLQITLIMIILFSDCTFFHSLFNVASLCFLKPPAIDTATTYIDLYGLFLQQGFRISDIFSISN